MAEEGKRQPVVLHVYDLSNGMARQFSAAFLGSPIEAIYHTGVVAYGTEYWFGAGIEQGPAGRTYFGPPLQRIDLGMTEVPKDLFEEFLREIGPQFNQDTYSLLKHNCNNFSEEVAQFLTGRGIPKYILDLPSRVLNSPNGALLVPLLQQLENSLRNGRTPGITGGGPQLAAPPSFPYPHDSQITHHEDLLHREQPQKENAQPSEKMQGSTQVETSCTQRAAKDHGGQEQDVVCKTLSAGSHTAPPTQEEESNRLASDRVKELIHEEVRKEFAMLMALGELGASEAAAMALQKVMERYQSNAGIKATSS